MKFSSFFLHYGEQKGLNGPDSFCSNHGRGGAKTPLVLDTVLLNQTWQKTVGWKCGAKIIVHSHSISVHWARNSRSTSTLEGLWKLLCVFFLLQKMRRVERSSGKTASDALVSHSNEKENGTWYRI